MEDLNTLKALRHEEPPVGCPPPTQATPTATLVCLKKFVCVVDRASSPPTVATQPARLCVISATWQP